MIDPSRFFSKLAASLTKPQPRALSYGVAMLGASVSDEYAHLEGKCYHYTRKYLEMIERQEDGENFAILDAL